MTAFIENFHWVLYVTGALTASTFLMALSPAKGLKDSFGVETSDPNILLMARHWGFYVGLAGLLLIYAGAYPEVRFPVLLFAIAGKSAIVLLLARRISQLPSGAKTIIVADTIMVALYLTYLVAS